MGKIINVVVFKPHEAMFKEHRSDRSECRVITCSNSENCDLFKKAKCTLIGINSTRCPYGAASREAGPTKRARKYREWISGKQEQHKEVLGKLSSADSIMAKVGDYVFLPYSFMGKCEAVPFVGTSGFMGSGGGFVKAEDFTVEVIHTLVVFRPQALMGGEISSYQKNEVPKFLKHLSEILPLKFEEFVSKYPQYMTFRDISNVGRKAKLLTLTPGIGQFKDIHGGLWSWDGQYLTSTNSKMSFGLVSKFEEMRVKPAGDPIVVVTDNDQVNLTTAFED